MAKPKSVMKQNLFGGKSGAKVIVDPEGVQAFLQQNKAVRDLLMATANNVKAAAESTAQGAQNGPGGTLAGYAEAGFSVEWHQRGRRPNVRIVSNADPVLAMRVHFYTQIAWGMAHLRLALHKGA